MASLALQGLIRVTAPAKVNLFLGIGARRTDGYHEVLTVMHALDLHDVLTMGYVSCYPEGQERKNQPIGEQGLESPESLGSRLCSGCSGTPGTPGISSRPPLRIELIEEAFEGLAPLGIPAKENLVVKAVRALIPFAGQVVHECGATLRIRLEKHIPAMAGLGGGSSDAAAALVGAAHLWGLDAYGHEVHAAAAELGSDVSFFLQGGCARFSGKGECFEQALIPQEGAVVLIRPEGGVSTAKAYAAFDKAPLHVSALIKHKVAASLRAQDVPLCNNLAPASESLLPELAQIRLWAAAQPGVGGVLLAGSGSATMVLCKDPSAAEVLSAAAKAQGWWARATAFSSTRAALS